MERRYAARGGARASWLLATGALALTLMASGRGYAAEVSADRSPPAVDRPMVAGEHRHRTFGLQMDVGVPDGAALGLSVRPGADWLRLGASVTHNAMAPGMRFGATFDPIAFPVAPTFTVEGGHYWVGTIPGAKDFPSVGYNYANLHLGLEFGSREAFRFFLRGGASWVDVAFANVGKAGGGTDSGVAMANPSLTGWVAPSAKLGFASYF